MRLTDLHPVFLSHGGSGVTNAAGEPVPITEGVGVCFDCPCGNLDEDHRCYVPFTPVLGPGPEPAPHPMERRWQRTGDTLETLTLTPSIFRRSAECRGAVLTEGQLPSGWHGVITNGEVTTA